MTVLITGAAGGLGRALSVECAALGYDLFLTDLREADLQLLRTGIKRRFDVCVRIHSCDLTNTKELSLLFERLDRESIMLDMLLNVAGVDFEGGFLERENEQLLQIVRLNIAATLAVTREALLRRRPEARFYIVFISSLASLYPMPLKATYAASKRFLSDFACALGEELRRQDVHILTVCPGGLPTTAEAVSGIEAQGFWGNITTNRPETVARTVLRKVRRGRKMYIPGAVNCVLGVAGHIVPRTLTARMLYRRWNAAQNRRWNRVRGQ